LTSLPEVAGDAALYADPENPRGFAAALHLAFSDDKLRQQLMERGCQNRGRFGWRRAAQATLEVYRHAAGMTAEKQVWA
jgi:glycosyltransferase involved in cell wall biosynthesis